MMDTRSSPFDSVAGFQAWLERAPAGTNLRAAEVARILGELAGVEIPTSAPAVQGEATPASWRERLWSVPAETRLGVAEVAEALGRPKSFVYARTGPKAEDPIPHRKLDGVLLFTAGELRAWLREREEVIHGGPMESMPAEKGGLRAL